MLNGEHFPWRERTITQTEQDLEIHPAQSIPPTRKRQPKWLAELYIWLLAILSAALFLTVYVKTSSGWLAFLSFLIPSLFIILWNVIISPKKNFRHRLEEHTTLGTDSSSSYAVLRIEYLDGHSPIGMDGIEISPSEDTSLPDL
ncbi:hypothetical protein P4255_16590 [Bacillus wiedmannii]|uniref:hypothetical protein n=1 Tax=Bacillus wiedmannii TaxID=1890302 RepID=UPI002E214B92|nr:hypothetical protein [Bacillus wiedmannii]